MQMDDELSYLKSYSYISLACCVVSGYDRRRLQQSEIWRQTIVMSSILAPWVRIFFNGTYVAFLAR